jgi:hypothetical protein
MRVQTRVRSRGLTRNRLGRTGVSRLPGYEKQRNGHARSLMWSAIPAPPRPNKKGARRRPPWHGDSPWAPRIDKEYRLPQPHLAGTLVDAMGVTPCGSAGWRWLPCTSIIASPSLFACPLLSLLTPKATKKRSHTPVALGNGRLRLQ